MRLLLISGSVRQGSTKTAVRRTAATVLPSGVEAELFADADRLPHAIPMTMCVAATRTTPCAR